MDDAQCDLQEARDFVREKGLLKLPPRDNLQVIETPVFMRGMYAVGGFNSAPSLEPQLGAFYWITPIPKSWPRERVESKLREYNFYKLKLLTIHEAIPGHYVQMENANEVEPRSRRLLRSVFGNGPYIEGWAQYRTQTVRRGFVPARNSFSLDESLAAQPFQVVSGMARRILGLALPALCANTTLLRRCSVHTSSPPP
jgi:hypothetical protein